MTGFQHYFRELSEAKAFLRGVEWAKTHISQGCELVTSGPYCVMLDADDEQELVRPIDVVYYSEVLMYATVVMEKAKK